MKNAAVYVGTYSKPILMGGGEIYYGKGDGIYTMEFSEEHGILQTHLPTVLADNASYLQTSADSKYLYAVNELALENSCINAYKINKNFSLKLLNSQLTNGASPCHICTDSQNRLLFTANYTSGSISVFPLNADGSLCSLSDLKEHDGKGYDPIRQERSHIHHVMLSSDETILYAVDLGLDVVYAYSIDYEHGTLKLLPDSCLQLRPGAGPRTLVLHPSGHYLYLTLELANSCLVFKQGNHGWEIIQEVSSLPEDYSDTNLAAEAAVSDDGHFLYLSNRGHDSIAVFSISFENGTLMPVQWISTEGITPRSFGLSPDNQWLIAANQDSSSLSIFKRNIDNGTLALSQKQELPTPVCIRMYHL